VPKNFSTVSHPEIVQALAEAAKALKVRYHLGWVYTTDALFQETPALIRELEGRAISGIDMVTSAFLTIAQVRNKKAGAILAVSDECLNGSIGFRHPRFLKAEDVMVDVVLKAVDLL
jgi:purine-nucleoside phosphorylase